MSLTLASRQWFMYLAPPSGGTVGIGPECKHLRLVYCPDDGKIWNFGGDWNNPNNSGSSCQTIWQYDPNADLGTGNGAGWTQKHQYCAFTGETTPAGMDQVTAVWDSTRHIFWCLPGYMPFLPDGIGLNELSLANPLTAGGSETELSVNEILNDPVGHPATNYAKASAANRAFIILNDDLTFEFVPYTGTDTTSLPHKIIGLQRGFGGTTKGAHPAGRFISLAWIPSCSSTSVVGGSIPWTAHSYDPTTNRFTARAQMRQFGVGEGISNGWYDPVQDAIYRFGGSSPLRVDRFQLPSLAQTQTSFSGFGSTSSWGYANVAFDPENRVAYTTKSDFTVSGVAVGKLIRYNIDSNTMTDLGPTPRAELQSGSAGIDNCYPCWDSNNRRILWPFVYDFSSGSQSLISNDRLDLWIYDPNTATWTNDDHVLDPRMPAGTLMKGNSWVYHPGLDCIVGMGRTYTVVNGVRVQPGYVDFYRYTAGTEGTGVPNSVSATVL